MIQPSPSDPQILLAHTQSLRAIARSLLRNEADVDSAADAVERFEALTPDQIATAERRVALSSEGFCTQCNYCADCPVDLPIVRIMEAYNVLMLSEGDPKRALDRLKNHFDLPDIAATLEVCTECRRCEEACTQHLPILERFEEFRRAQAEGKKK